MIRAIKYPLKMYNDRPVAASVMHEYFNRLYEVEYYVKFRFETIISIVLKKLSR